MHTRLNTLAFITLLGLGGINSPAQAEQQCRLQLSESTLDLGRFNRDQPVQVKGTNLLSLDKRVLNLFATCGANSVMGLAFKGQSGEEKGYRFAKNGVFVLKVINAQLDGKPVRLRPHNAEEIATSELLIQPGQELLPYVGTFPVSGEHLTVQVEIETRIDSAGTRVSADEDWEGSGQFEVRMFAP
ncbi:hypothetical protein [Pseudomonas fluorescens]|uniref:hypothetical protein n=1 Tax=Pseudomonas fluorescens TaxID=294 RepID=UPI0020047684|nr:hypothetical protein [Pseudomonas fluorescens]MCK3832726.1 hypothetical protein [Pseudomonas fluorescens]